MKSSGHNSSLRGTIGVQQNHQELGLLGSSARHSPITANASRRHHNKGGAPVMLLLAMTSTRARGSAGSGSLSARSSLRRSGRRSERQAGGNSNRHLSVSSDRRGATTEGRSTARHSPTRVSHRDASTPAMQPTERKCPAHARAQNRDQRPNATEPSEAESARRHEGRGHCEVSPTQVRAIPRHARRRRKNMRFPPSTTQRRNQILDVLSNLAMRSVSGRAPLSARSSSARAGQAGRALRALP